MAEFEDLYEILQVHPSAHPEVIQAAYWQLTQLYDPDRNPYPNAIEMMAAINRAHRVLSDPSQRATYDQYRQYRETCSQIPDVVQAKSFQVVDDEGNVRAELACRAVNYRDSHDYPPTLELRDSDRHPRFSISLDYFDQPRLVMRDLEDENDQLSVSLEIDAGEARLAMRDKDDVDRIKVVLPSEEFSLPNHISGPKFEMRDKSGFLRLEAGLLGGDEGDSPRLVMRDRDGGIRFEVELEKLEIHEGEVTIINGDFESPPSRYVYPTRMKIRDENGSIRLEIGLLDDDSGDGPTLSLRDGDENIRLEVGYRGDSSRVVMKDTYGIDRLEVELVEVKIDGGYNYLPRVRVRDEDERIAFEMGLPDS